MKLDRGETLPDLDLPAEPTGDVADGPRFTKARGKTRTKARPKAKS